jgi:transcriptional regulator with XRE-family HTH domain
MNMGERIRQLRIEHNMTQEELGIKLDLQKSAIAKYENNKVSNMKRSTIEKMSKLFDVSPSFLMCLEDNVKVSGGDIPQELEDLGAEWVGVSKMAKESGLTPAEFEKLINAVKGIKQV